MPLYYNYGPPQPQQPPEAEVSLLSTVPEETFELPGPSFSSSRMSEEGLQMLELEEEMKNWELSQVGAVGGEEEDDGENKISEDAAEKMIVFRTPLPPTPMKSNKKNQDQYGYNNNSNSYMSPDHHLSPTPMKSNKVNQEQSGINNNSPHPRLSEQFSQGHEALDAAKAAVYAEQARVKELTELLKSTETDVKDCKAVINVLTTQLKEVDDEARHLKIEAFEKGKVAEEALGELGEAKKIVEREERRRIRLESKMKEYMKEMDGVKKSLAEAKNEIEKKSKEVVEMGKQIEELKQKIDEDKTQQLKETVTHLEFVVRENEFKLEEKQLAVEASKKNVQLLKDACAVLEDQLKRVEVIVDEKEELLRKALVEKVALIEGIKAKDEQIRAAKMETNEAQSQQHLLKKQLENLQAVSDKEIQEKDDVIAHLRRSYDEMKNEYEEQLVNQSTDFQKSIDDIKNLYEEKLQDQASLARQITALKEEKEVLECVNHELKTKEVRYGLEISRYLENIVNVKEQNINLKTDLHEATQKVEFYRKRATELIEEKNNADMDMMQKEAELQSKINQQAKLVQFFQNQAQLLSAKKKKFRFFGKDKPIELPEPPTDLTPQTKKKYFPDVSFVPRTPSSTSKTPTRALPEPTIKAKLNFDDEEFSSTEDQPVDEGSSSHATSTSDSFTSA